MTNDWVEVWKLRRDICYLYHELNWDYGHITGDLDYGDFYSMPYWSFLTGELPKMNKWDQDFVRQGCLIMLYCMAWDLIEGSGSFLVNKLSICQQEVASLLTQEQDANTKKLAQLVEKALHLADAESSGERLQSSKESLATENRWAYETFIIGYFEDMVDK